MQIARDARRLGSGGSSGHTRTGRPAKANRRQIDGRGRKKRRTCFAKSASDDLEVSRGEKNQQFAVLDLGECQRANGDAPHGGAGSDASKTVTGGDKPTAPSYLYEQVGVNIDTTASTAEAGQFQVDLKINDTSVSPNNQMQGAPVVSGVPVFRTFSTTHTVLLKDGQSAQLITATDPVSGDVTRVDVTLSVVK